MTRTARWLIPMGAALALGLAACGGGSKPAADDAKPAAAVEEEGTGRLGSYPLHFRKPFPDLNVYALDGTKVSSASLVQGGNTVVLFVSTSCHVCGETIETWDNLRYQIPDSMHVVCIVDEDLEFAQAWAEQDQFPFPLYVDTRSAFALRHGVEHYPTAVGVDADGTILWVRRGVSEMFIPSRAEELLQRGKEELHKREAGDEGSEFDG